MNNSELVLFEERGNIVVIKLNRPEKRNAINAEMTARLREEIKRFIANDALRVGIIVGHDDFFCSGMDLQAFSAGEGNDILYGEGRFAGIVSANCPKPIIAAVEGPALAGGFEIAIACDIIVASSSASFGLPEVKVGLFAGAGGSFRLPQLIPHKKAIELMLTGQRFLAQEAKEMGLINHITEPGMSLNLALEIAEQIALNSPVGVAYALKLARLSLSESEDNLWNINDEKMLKISESLDAKEGAKAFLEKRSPNWLGK